MQSPGYARGIVDDGTVGDAHIASEVVREAPSPAPGRIARDRAVRDAEAAFVRKATAMLGRIVAEGAVANAHFTFLVVKEASTAPSRLIAAEGAVRDGYLASRAEKPPTPLCLPIDDGQSFEQEGHILDQEHAHLLAPIQNHHVPIAVQSQASGAQTFPLDGKRAGEGDRTRTRKDDRVPIGSILDKLLKLAIIAAICDGKRGHGMVSPFSIWTSRLLSHVVSVEASSARRR